MNNAYPSKSNHKGPKTKWVSKTTPRALQSFMSLKVNTNNGCWYLDSGSSRHMIGNISYFTTLTKIDGNTTFANSGKGKISGEDTIITFTITLMMYFMLKD